MLRYLWSPELAPVFKRTIANREASFALHTNREVSLALHIVRLHKLIWLPGEQWPARPMSINRPQLAAFAGRFPASYVKLFTAQALQRRSGGGFRCAVE